MGFSLSPLAFEDIKSAYDRAIASKKGIRIPCETRGEAVLLRTRFNHFRIHDRRENKRTYPSDHPLHGWSIYDQFVLRIPRKGSDDERVLYIEKRLPSDLKIEEISEETNDV